MRILVAALNQLLLSFLKSERSHKTLAIARNVDVGHVAWVVDSRLSLQVCDRLTVALAGHDGRRVVVALVNVSSWLTIALHVGLIGRRLRHDSIRIATAVIR